MIRWADPARVERAVRDLADRLAHRGEVRRVYWYGSWVSGTPTAGSDVDLCIIVADDPRPGRARIPDYLPDRFPVPLDLTVFTEAEWASLPDRAPTWHAAITSGRLMDLQPP